ncbi:MAG: FAD-dependent oxidoreductase [Pseudomonadota bacterium]
MDTQFDVMVVGAGMMGSAAARHLVDAGQRVILIGPEEPDDTKSHEGVFASHYDQARITRRMDQDMDWARLSSASIERYAEIEARAGMTFFHPVGSLIAGPEEGPGSEYIQKCARLGRTEGISFEEARGQRLRELFPYLDLPDGTLGLYETDTGGWINPRDHVAAQIRAGVKAGVTHHVAEVQSVEDDANGMIATCSDGTRISASKVVIACGGFSKAGGLLPQPPDLRVYARTIVYFELAEAQVERMSTMPSVIYGPPDAPCIPYILPPVRYPDGKHYIKIGGDPDNVQLTDVEEIKAWFRTDGNAEVAAFLTDALIALIPDLRDAPRSTGSCVTSFTSYGKPLVQKQTDRIFALTGGNGAGAKCSDEIGRLGADLVINGRLDADQYTTSFRPSDP